MCQMGVWKVKPSLQLIIIIRISILIFQLLETVLKKLKKKDYEEYALLLNYIIEDTFACLAPLCHTEVACL